MARRGRGCGKSRRRSTVRDEDAAEQKTAGGIVANDGRQVRHLRVRPS